MELNCLTGSLEVDFKFVRVVKVQWLKMRNFAGNIVFNVPDFFPRLVKTTLKVKPIKALIKKASQLYCRMMKWQIGNQTSSE